MHARSIVCETVPVVSPFAVARLLAIAATRLVVGRVRSIGSLARRRWRLPAASSLLLLAASPAFAQDPVPPIASVATVDFRNSGGPLQHVEGAEPATAELSWTPTNPLFDAQLVGRAETFGGAMPAATAELEVSASKLEEFGTGQFRGSASGVLYYWMRIRERRAPPIAFQPQLRVHARVVGEASVSASGGGATAAAFASVAGQFSATAEARTDGATSDGFDESFVFVVLPGQAVQLAVSASAAAGVNVNSSLPAGSASAQAFADPVLRFDEEAFAQYLADRGDEPFLQADYYEFEFSEHIAVPEPSRVASLPCVTAAIWMLRRRRKSGR